MVVTGAECGAGLVQPAPANVAGAELAAAAPVPAQLGGTDNPPSEDAWPRPAETGPADAAAIGAVGMNGASAAPGRNAPLGSSGVQLTALGRN